MLESASMLKFYSMLKFNIMLLTSHFKGLIKNIWKIETSFRNLFLYMLTEELASLLILALFHQKAALLGRQCENSSLC